jgi:hypothetical protein
MASRFEYCPNCCEHVDRGLCEEIGKAQCDHCEETVEPLSDPDGADMGFKTKHPIRCTDCEGSPRLVGLHMGQYTDGTIVACECTSLDSVPYELQDHDLPTNWKMIHDEQLPEANE